MKTLKMVFTLENDNVLTFSLQDPKEGLTQAEVEAAMQSMITKRAVVAGGSYAKSIKEAYIYETDKQELA